MEPSTSSASGVISENKLKMWKIFRNVGADGEEILKTAKLAHAADSRHGFVVTMTDETYSFVCENPSAGVYKISKIPELSGVQVKEFLTGSVNYAITEDGRLFSWSSELDGIEAYNRHLVDQLGRHVSCRATDKITLFYRPAPVTESLPGVKVRQLALPGCKGTYTVALSLGGEVHQWGFSIHNSWKPNLISKKHFDFQEIISVTCSDRMGVALTSKGELYQWEVLLVPRKVLGGGSVPFKKITGSSGYIFALTVKGQMGYFVIDTEYWRSDDNSSEEDSWSGAGSDHDDSSVDDDAPIEDLASCGPAGNLVVVELKNNTRFTFSYCQNENLYPPHIPSFTLPSGASIDELFSKFGSTCYQTISAQIEPPPRRMSDDICNLWQNKEHADVTFSVDEKVIMAHKCILAGRSDYFKKMFRNEWNKAKGGSSAIEVKDVKHAIFEALLVYIYTEKIKFKENEYRNIFDLMKLADSYREVNIRHECEKILIRNINAENAFFLARNASSANALTLEGKVIKFIVNNQLLVNNSSILKMIELVGIDAFQKISVALVQLYK